EDGIRDFHVTGVQTCALPISQRQRPTYRFVQLLIPLTVGVEAVPHTSGLLRIAQRRCVGKVAGLQQIKQAPRGLAVEGEQGGVTTAGPQGLERFYRAVVRAEE